MTAVNVELLDKKTEGDKPEPDQVRGETWPLGF
jgi:hypothetical protein